MSDTEYTVLDRRILGQEWCNEDVKMKTRTIFTYVHNDVTSEIEIQVFAYYQTNDPAGAASWEVMRCVSRDYVNRGMLDPAFNEMMGYREKALELELLEADDPVVMGFNCFQSLAFPHQYTTYDQIDEDGEPMIFSEGMGILVTDHDVREPAWNEDTMTMEYPTTVSYLMKGEIHRQECLVQIKYEGHSAEIARQYELEHRHGYHLTKDAYFDDGFIEMMHKKQEMLADGIDPFDGSDDAIDPDEPDLVIMGTKMTANCDCCDGDNTE